MSDGKGSDVRNLFFDPVPKKKPRLNVRRGKLVLWQQATGTGGNSISF